MDRSERAMGQFVVIMGYDGVWTLLVRDGQGVVMVVKTLNGE